MYLLLVYIFLFITTFSVCISHFTCNSECFQSIFFTMNSISRITYQNSHISQSYREITKKIE